MKRKKMFKREKGAVALISIFAAMLFITIAAVVIDGGLLYYKASKLQNAVDASVIATSHHIGSSEDYLNMYAEKYLRENGFDKEKYGTKMAINITRKGVSSNGSSDQEDMTEGYIRLNVIIEDNSILGVFSGIESLNLNKTGYAKCNVEHKAPESLDYSIIADSIKKANTYGEAAIQMASHDTVQTINQSFGQNLSALKSYVNPKALLVDSLDSTINGISMEGDVHSNSDINVSAPYLDLTFGRGSKLFAANKIYFSNSSTSPNVSVGNGLSVSPKDNDTEIKFVTSSSGGTSISTDFDLLEEILKTVGPTTKMYYPETLVSEYELAVNNYCNDHHLDSDTKDRLLSYNVSIAGTMGNWVIEGTTTTNNYTITNYVGYRFINNLGPTNLVSTPSGDSSGSAEIGDTQTYTFSFTRNYAPKNVNVTISFSSATQNVKLYSDDLLTPDLKITLGRTFLEHRALLEIPNLTQSVNEKVNSSLHNVLNNVVDDSDTIDNVFDKQTTDLQGDVFVPFGINNYANSETFFIKSIDKKITSSEEKRKYHIYNYTLSTPTTMINRFETTMGTYGQDAVNSFYDTNIKNTYLEDDTKSSKEFNKYIEKVKEKIQNTKGYHFFKKLMDQWSFKNEHDGKQFDTEAEDEVFLTDKNSSVPGKTLKDQLNIDTSDYSTEFKYFNSRDELSIERPNMVTPSINGYYNFNVNTKVVKRNPWEQKQERAWSVSAIMSYSKGNPYSKDFDYYLPRVFGNDFRNIYGDSWTVSGYSNGADDPNAFANCQWNGTWGGDHSKRPRNFKHIECNYFRNGGGLFVFPSSNSDKGKNFVRADRTLQTGHNVSVAQGCGVVVNGTPSGSEGRAKSEIGLTNNVFYSNEGIQFVNTYDANYADNDSTDTAYVIVNGDTEVGRIAAIRRDEFQNTPASHGVVIINGDLILNGYHNGTEYNYFKDRVDDCRFIWHDANCTLTVVVTGSIRPQAKDSNNYTNPTTLKIQSGTTVVCGSIDYNVEVESGGEFYVKNFGSYYNPRKLVLADSAKFSCIGDGNCYLRDDSVVSFYNTTGHTSLNNFYAPNTILTNNDELYLKGSMTLKGLTNNNQINTSLDYVSSGYDIVINGDFNNSNIARFDRKAVSVSGNYNQNVSSDIAGYGIYARRLYVSQNMNVLYGSVLIDEYRGSGPNDTLRVGGTLTTEKTSVVYVCRSSPQDSDRAKVYIGNDLVMKNTSKLYVDNTLEVKGKIYMTYDTDKNKSAWIVSTSIIDIKFTDDPNDGVTKPDIMKFNYPYITSYYFSYRNGDYPWINYKNMKHAKYLVIGEGQKFKIKGNNLQFSDPELVIVNYGNIYIDDDYYGEKVLNIKNIENRGLFISKLSLNISGSKNIKNGTQTLSNSSLYNSGQMYVNNSIITNSTVYNYGGKLYVKGDLSVKGNNTNYNAFRIFGSNNEVYISGRIKGDTYSLNTQIDDNSSGVFSVYGLYKDGLANKNNSFKNFYAFNNYGCDMTIYLKTDDNDKISLTQMNNRGQMFVYGSLRVTNTVSLYSDGSSVGKLIAEKDLFFDEKLYLNYSHSEYRQYDGNFIVKAYNEMYFTKSFIIYGAGELYGMKRIVDGLTSENYYGIYVYDNGLVYFGPDSVVPNTLNIYGRTDSTPNYRGKVYLPPKDGKSTVIRFGFPGTDATMSDGAILAIGGNVSNFDNTNISMNGNSIIHINGTTTISDSTKIFNNLGELYFMGNVNMPDVTSKALVFNENCINYFGPVNDTDSDGYGTLNRDSFVADGKNYFYKNSVDVFNYSTSADKVGDRNTAIQIKGGETYVSCDVNVKVAEAAVKVNNGSVLHCANLNTLSALHNNGNLIIREKLNFTNENGNFANRCSEEGISLSQCQNAYQLRNGYDEFDDDNENAILYIGSSDSDYVLKLQGSLLNNANLYVNGGISSNGNKNNVSIETADSTQTHFAKGATLYAGIRNGLNSDISFENACSFATAIINGGNFIAKDSLTYNTNLNPVYSIDSYSILNGNELNKDAVIYVGNSGISLANENCGTVQNYGAMYVNGPIDNYSNRDSSKNSVGMHLMNDSLTYITGNCNIANAGFVTSQGSYFMCGGDLTSGACARINANENLLDTSDVSSQAYVYVGGNMKISKMGNDELGNLSAISDDNEFRINSNSNVYVGGYLSSNSHNIVNDNVTLSANGYIDSTDSFDSGKNFNVFTKSYFNVTNGSFKVDDNALLIVGDSMLVTNDIELGDNYSFKSNAFGDDLTSSSKGGKFYIKDSLISKDGSIIEGGLSKTIVGKSICTGDSLNVANNASLWVVGENRLDIKQKIGTTQTSVFADGFSGDSLKQYFFDGKNVPLANVDMNGLVYSFGGINIEKNSSIISDNVYSNGNSLIKQGAVIYANNDVSLVAKNTDSLDDCNISLQGKKVTTLVCNSTRVHNKGYTMYAFNYDSSRKYLCDRCNTILGVVNDGNNGEGVSCPVTIYAGNSVSISGSENIRNANIVANNGDVVMNTTHFEDGDESDENVKALSGTVVSLNGNVTFDAVSSKFGSLFYAPRGAITFDGYNHEIWGNCFAKTVNLNSYGMKFHKNDAMVKQESTLPTAGNVFLISDKEFDEVESNVY